MKLSIGLCLVTVLAVFSNNHAVVSVDATNRFELNMDANDSCSVERRSLMEIMKDYTSSRSAFFSILKAPCGFVMHWYNKLINHPRVPQFIRGNLRKFLQRPQPSERDVNASELAAKLESRRSRKHLVQDGILFFDPTVDGEVLESELGNRVEKSKLEEKNILKREDSSTMEERAAQLGMQITADKLKNKLENRPDVDEVRERGIYQTPFDANRKSLERQFAAHEVGISLERQPTVEDLKKRNILAPESSADI